MRRGWRASAVAAAVLALVWTGVSRAQLPLPVQVVPLVGNITADPTSPWRTDLEVANLGQTPATAGLRFFPEQATNSFDGTFATTLVIQAGETRRVTDLLSSLFPELRSRRGWLLVADATPIDCKASERPYPALLAVSSRSYREASRGAGASIQPNWLAINLGQFPSVFVSGTAASAAAASHRAVGVANLSTSGIKVRIRQLAADGRSSGNAERAVPPLSLGMWTLAELKLPPERKGGREEVGLAEDPAINPCSIAKLPPPCSDPCDRTACTQRYRLPGAPIFFAFETVVDRASGALEYITPATDQVGGIRYLNEYRQKHCPELAGAESIVDLGAKLLFLRDPAGLRKVTP